MCGSVERWMVEGRSATIWRPCMSSRGRHWLAASLPTSEMSVCKRLMTMLGATNTTPNPSLDFIYCPICPIYTVLTKYIL